MALILLGSLSERSTAHPGPRGRAAEFVAARGIALFWPMLEQHEVDVRGLDALARAAGKRVYYPGFMRSPAGGLCTDLLLTTSVARRARAP